MKSNDFIALCRFNKITQHELAWELQCNRSTIGRWLKKEYVPLSYIRVLSKILNVDLTNEKILERYTSNIPKEYFIPRKKEEEIDWRYVY